VHLPEVKQTLGLCYQILDAIYNLFCISCWKIQWGGHNSPICIYYVVYSWCSDWSPTIYTLSL